MVFKGNAVKLIRSGLCDNSDGCSAGHPLLWVEVIRGDVDFLNGFGRRNIDGVVRQPNEHIGGPVDASIVVVAIGAVDVRAQSAFWRVRNRILENPWRRSRHEINQRLIIPVLVQRHV